MKPGPLSIYVDRLKDDGIEEISEVFDPALLEMEDEDLHFVGNMSLDGRAYLVKTHLILELKFQVEAKMPCAICNEKTTFKIKVDDFSHNQELSTIKTGVWDYAEELRSAILIHVPQFHECNEGHCLHRKNVANFLKPSSDETHTPFKDLDW